MNKEKLKKYLINAVRVLCALPFICAFAFGLHAFWGNTSLWFFLLSMLLILFISNFLFKLGDAKLKDKTVRAAFIILCVVCLLLFYLSAGRRNSNV